MHASLLVEASNLNSANVGISILSIAASMRRR
jgi:hypothetical protein